MADTPKLSLDDLLTRAMVKQTPKVTRRKPSDSITAKELAEADRRMKERFTLPENWEQVRIVALIHEETETLLGNFAEMRHKLTTGCRRLVRVSAPTAVSEFERVSGANWLNGTPIAARIEGANAEEEREAICDLHLPELGHVFAPAAMVTVKLLWGGISEVRLIDETRFFDKDKRQHLILPEGLDVLEVMSLESKLKLREWLGL